MSVYSRALILCYSSRIVFRCLDFAEMAQESVGPKSGMSDREDGPILMMLI